MLLRACLAGCLALNLCAIAASSAEPLKVGLITTLSGGGAGLGIDTRDGFLLAIKQAKNSDIQVLVEDDAMKPELAVQIANKMMESSKVSVITGVIWSNLALAVAPIVTGAGRFYISTVAGPWQLAGPKCHRNYFNVSYQNDNLHEAMGQYANDQKFRRMFILAPNYPAGTDALKGFKRYYKGALVGEVYSKLGQDDYATEIAQIRDSKPDAVFFFLPGGMGISFMKQYSQSGIPISVISPGSSFDQDVLPAIGKPAVGVRNSGNWSKDLDNDANRDFVATFREAYGRLPSLYAAQAFDAANLIISAASRASIKDAGAFRSAIKSAAFKSVRGKFKFNKNNHPVQDIYVREVVEENGVLTNRIVGTTFADHADVYADQCAM